MSTPPLTPGLGPHDLRASEAGTAAFVGRFAPKFEPHYFRTGPHKVALSSIGIGTYLGENTDDDDTAYVSAIHRAVARGVNLIDTAINYRCQRSELAVGSAIQQLLASHTSARHELVVCSKAGYIPLDGTPPASREDYQRYVQKEFVDAEILRPEEIVAGGHSLAPRFLRYCIAKSRQNLGLRCVDVFYLHNPEQQLASVSVSELHGRIRAAFSVLEDAVARGDIGLYGVSTWDGLRVPPTARGHLSLETLVALATDVAGDGHHLRFIQLPVSLGMPEAARVATQTLAGREVTAIEAATGLGLTVIGSAPLMQSRLTSGLPPALADHFPHCVTDAQRAVSFARSAPGVTSVLIGMRRESHVDENLAAAKASDHLAT